MDSNYMVIPHLKMRIEIKNTPYILNFGSRSVQVSPSMELWYIYATHDSDMHGEIASALKKSFSDISISEIDSFYKAFEEEHESFRDSKVTINDVSRYAIDRNWVMSTVFYDIEIKPDFESKLLQEIKYPDKDRTPLIDRLMDSFQEYRERYGYDTKFKKDRKNQDYELANQFCIQHGIKLAWAEEQANKMLPISNLLSNMKFTLAGLVVWAIVPSVFFYLSDVVKPYAFGLSAACILIGASVFFAPFLLINKNK